MNESQYSANAIQYSKALQERQGLTQGFRFTKTTKVSVI